MLYNNGTALLVARYHSAMLSAFCQRLGLTLPIIQAPMAGVSTPTLAAAVGAAGGLGSIAVGAMSADDAERAIVDLRGRTTAAFNVNVFCHRPLRRNADPHAAAASANDAAKDTAAKEMAAKELAWCDRLAGLFRQFGAVPPPTLREIYTSFVDDAAMQAVLLRQRPAVVSFHFGLPTANVTQALRAAGVITLATVTTLAEAHAAAAAGVDALVAQGYEAGGHRGIFDENAPDDRLGTMALVRLLVQGQPLPVIAAGGIMDGAGVAAALSLGAAAAQLGTAFVACRESSADAAYRAALTSEAAHHTTMTRVISGRPARCLANAFTRFGTDITDADVPAYPLAYDAGKALNAAAKAAGGTGYGAQWAGQGAPLCRPMPAGQLMATLARELTTARR